MLPEPDQTVKKKMPRKQVLLTDLLPSRSSRLKGGSQPGLAAPLSRPQLGKNRELSASCRARGYR